MPISFLEDRPASWAAKEPVKVEANPEAADAQDQETIKARYTWADKLLGRRLIAETETGKSMVRSHMPKKCTNWGSFVDEVNVQDLQAL